MGQASMNHRDVISISLAAVSMASSLWLPFFEEVSKYAPIILTVLGIVLAAVQIVYYVRLLLK